MTLWLGGRTLVLASQSESRHAILSAAGIPHAIDPAGLDERRIEQRGGASAAELAQVLAREKALVVSARRPGALVLGADQTTARGSPRVSKPTDPLAPGERV